MSSECRVFGEAKEDTTISDVFMSEEYALGHDPAELTRLSQQMSLLDDPALVPLARASRDCLDIGFGSGSLIEAMRQANPTIRCIGVDIGRAAVEAAKSRFRDDTLVTIHQMSGADLRFPDGSFDLVTCRLVLWAAGNSFPTIIREAFRVLRPGGTFYVFEPDDHLLIFYPPKQAISQVIDAWDKRMCELGMDPFVGRKVPGTLLETGFASLDAQLFPKVVIGADRVRYLPAMSNLSSLYLGSDSSGAALGLSDETIRQAVAEFSSCEPNDLLFEGYFVTVATKP